MRLIAVPPWSLASPAMIINQGKTLPMRVFRRLPFLVALVAPLALTGCPQKPPLNQEPPNVCLGFETPDGQRLNAAAATGDVLYRRLTLVNRCPWTADLEVAWNCAYDDAETRPYDDARVLNPGEAWLSALACPETENPIAQVDVSYCDAGGSEPSVVNCPDRSTFTRTLAANVPRPEPTPTPQPRAEPVAPRTDTGSSGFSRSSRHGDDVFRRSQPMQHGGSQPFGSGGGQGDVIPIQ